MRTFALVLAAAALFGFDAAAQSYGSGSGTGAGLDDLTLIEKTRDCKTGYHLNNRNKCVRIKKKRSAPGSTPKGSH
ncbi:MAG: hypothetical protein NW217_13555 [Hyphomicrobiaceae bacterium]|nr:hypothetical protein [Hyphomicrobiaceae bacterium]